MFFYYFDRYYWILIVPAMIFALWAQSRVSSTYGKYSRVMSARGMSAADVCRKILDENGLYHIRIERVAGNLTDHYDPRAGVIRLSDSVFNSASVASIGVAAHEAGHAVQYAEGYVPIKIRNAIIPISQFGSSLSMPVLLIGLLFNYGVLVQLGIILFSTVALFQLVTLPVEFDASAKALRNQNGRKGAQGGSFNLCCGTAFEPCTAFEAGFIIRKKKQRLVCGKIGAVKGQHQFVI